MVFVWGARHFNLVAAGGAIFWDNLGGGPASSAPGGDERAQMSRMLPLLTRSRRGQPTVPRLPPRMGRR